jgi:ABC-type branched-subunit amino acid transport system ATPase component
MQVRGLRKAFGGQIVLDSVSVDLHEGEVVLLEGDNGSGKTTLLNILTGNLQPDAGSIWLEGDGAEESFRFPLRWWQEINPFSHFTSERVAREAVGRTWQDARLFPTLTLLDNIAVAAPDQTGENPARVLLRYATTRHHERINKQECVSLLALLGLAGREESLGGGISQGQTKRVAIARAVRAGARILFLDEPLAGLDGEGIDSVVALLQSIVRSAGVTLVIVEHVFNIPRIRRLADTVWTLQDGRIRVRQSRAAVEAEAAGRDCIVQTLVDKLAGPDDLVRSFEVPGGATFLRIGRSRLKAPQEPILAVRDLVVRRQGHVVIGRQAGSVEPQGLSFRLLPGDVAILQAPNGWGKSTLLEALAGLIPIDQGTLQLRGVDALRLWTWERARLGLRLFTTRSDLFPNLTVEEFATLNRRTLPMDDQHLDSKLRLGELSGGERQRLTLSILASPGTLALLDEPFLGLDSAAVTATIEMLRVVTCELSGTLLIALPSSIAEKPPSDPR